MLLIVGMPRSGTTWLAKIFDSHPDVLYLNEPDSVLRTETVAPFNAPPFDCDQLEVAAEYIRALCDVRTAKVVGTLPHFPKSYMASSMFQVHRILVIATKLAERVPRMGSLFKRVRIPELARSGKQPSLVVKSVVSLGRADLFMAACPILKSILIVRHPCGHIASVLQGIRARKFEASVPITEDMGVYRSIAALSYSRRLGIDIAAFREMSPIERLAWRWAIINSVTMEALHDNPRARIIRYEDLCDDPVSLSRSLFDFAQFDWNGQTESFVNASTHSSSTERFYQVFRNPQTAANKWRQELTQEDIAKVLRIVEQSPAGRLFSDHHQAA